MQQNLIFIHDDSILLCLKNIGIMGIKIGANVLNIHNYNVTMQTT